MVYRGRPSLGCAECRLTRRKCDLLRPGCSQCRRKKIPCTGYRNQLDLRFVDSTDKVIAEATHENKATTAPIQSLQSPRIGARIARDEARSSSMSCAKSSTSLRAFPNPSFYIDSTATMCFFDNYVRDGPNKLRTDMGFMLDIFQQAQPDDMFSRTIHALGLLTLSSATHDLEQASIARVRYTSALRLTNTALRSPAKAKSDLVLATVYLLMIYETMNCSGWFMDSWASHVNGAIKLLQLRGKDQCRDFNGLRLFQLLRAQILTNCLFRSQVVPDIVQVLTQLPNDQTSLAERALNELCAISARFCTLCLELDNRDYTHEAAIQALNQVDHTLVQWTTSLPSQYKVAKFQGQPTELPLYANMHSYQDHWIAATWNIYRGLRIMANEMIRHRLLAPDSQFDASTIRAELCRSEAIEANLRLDIYASSAYLLQVSSVSSDHFTAYAGFSACWPLFMAACDDRAPTGLLLACAQLLQRIADETGLQLAGVFARELFNRPFRTLQLGKPAAVGRKQIAG